jgi:hypothetical protein
MSNIIAFPSDAKRKRSAGPPRPNCEAEILFFLGVRYSRMTDPPHTASDAPNERSNNSTRSRRRKSGA